MAVFAESSLTGTGFSGIGPNQFQWSGINLPSGQSATFAIMGVVSSALTNGDAYVDLVNVSASPAEIDTNASTAVVDADVVGPVPQSIAFTGPASGVVGQSATLSATGGGSGNPVVFSVDPTSGAGVCAVSGADGSTLTYSQPGVCVVDADQAGNTSYAAAPTVTVDIVVDEVPAFTAEAPPSTAVVGTTYSYSFAADGAPAPTFALAAGAPSWLTLNSSTGVLSGTPPSGTTSFAYSVVATNSVGSATAGPFGVTVAMQPPPHPFDADIFAALACPTSLPLNSIGSCTLTVSNLGPATARFVNATLVLPYHLARVWTWWGVPWWGASWFGNSGLFFVGSLAPGTSVTYSVSFIAFGPTWGSVLGAAFSFNHDSNYTNNVATATVTVTR